MYALLEDSAVQDGSIPLGRMWMGMVSVDRMGAPILGADVDGSGIDGWSGKHGLQYGQLWMGRGVARLCVGRAGGLNGLERFCRFMCLRMHVLFASIRFVRFVSVRAPPCN